jgi:hypothetical protein
MAKVGGLRYLCRGQWLDSSWISFLQEQTMGKHWVRVEVLPKTGLSVILGPVKMTGERTRFSVGLTGWS